MINSNNSKWYEEKLLKATEKVLYCLSQLYNYLKKNYPEIETDAYLEEPDRTFRFLKGFDRINSRFDVEKDYDLMIVLEMDEEALPGWDASEIHHRWKDEYGHLVAKKAIFDCE